MNGTNKKQNIPQIINQSGFFFKLLFGTSKYMQYLWMFLHANQLITFVTIHRPNILVLYDTDIELV
jgi:hypothetical protein